MSSQTIHERQRRTGVPRARWGGPRAVPDVLGKPDPVPPPRRLAGMCAWAALLGFVGIAVGVRGLIAIMVKAPHWYEPTLVGLGLAGIGLAVVAFVTVHYRYVPWL